LSIENKNLKIKIYLYTFISIDGKRLYTPYSSTTLHLKQLFITHNNKNSSQKDTITNRLLHFSLKKPKKHIPVHLFSKNEIINLLAPSSPSTAKNLLKNT